MNLSDDEIICLILALYYYQQDYTNVEVKDNKPGKSTTAQRQFVEIENQVTVLREKLEDHLLTTQSPKYAILYADFIKAVAQTMEEKKMNKRIEEML